MVIAATEQTFALGRSQSSIDDYGVTEKIVHAALDPRSWSRRRCIVLASILTVGVVMMILIAVEVSNANRYPRYSTLEYRLEHIYAAGFFFDNFNYFSDWDPAQGFVHYAAQPAALALNLTFATSASAIIRVDTSGTDSTTGRISVRLESKQTYTSGLFIFDVIHSPVGCATWPALWLTDSYHWPQHGEIHVMESINNAVMGNQVTLHTDGGCKMDVKRKQAGKSLQKDCHNITNHNTGCGVQTPTYTIGREFNEQGGGLYALEWRGEGIRMWFFDRFSVPIDLAFVAGGHATNPSLTSPATSSASLSHTLTQATSSPTSTASITTTPNPGAWGSPIADFPSTHCAPTHFQNMSVIINIDICGGMAADPKAWAEDGCAGDGAPTCVEYASTAPGMAFEEAYWEIGGVWVFQTDSVG